MPRLVGKAHIAQQRAAAVTDRGAREMVAVSGIDRVEEWDPQIVDQVEAAERLRQLEAAGEPQPGALVGRQAVDRTPIEDDIATVVVQHAGEAIDERALARAVGADQPEPLAVRDGEVDALQRDKAAKALAESADLEDRPFHHRVDRRRQRLWKSPTMPLGAMITNRISSTPTINRLRAEEIVTVASCWMVPSSTAPMIGPIQLVMPPIIGIATLFTA